MSDASFDERPTAGRGGSSFLDWQLDRHADADRRMLHLTTGTDADGHPVITVAGEVDLVTAPDLRTAIDDCIAQGARQISLDLRPLAFIDSTGLAVLVGTTKRLAEMGGTLTLLEPGDLVRRALEITGLDRYLRIGDDDGETGDGAG